LGGVLSGSAAMMERIFNSEYMTVGSGISPFNAWLLIRGLRTLPARLDRITASTKKVIDFLKQHPKVEGLLFPLDESFPQYELAREQMKGGCGLLTFIIKADTIQQIEKFCEDLEHIFMAVSWGGHESLVIPKCSSLQPAEFNVANKEHRMIRLYVGLEDPEYIIKDLGQAFDKLV
jgi:cystathionine beta-lyase/cystathionine gamma-synthase